MMTRMKSALGAVLALSQLAAGLNLTFMGNCTDFYKEHLTRDFRNYPHLNATAATSFTLPEVTGNDDPWYYYLTVVDNTYMNETSFMYHWVGVPGSFLASEQGSKTRFCMAMSGGQDKSLKNTQGNDTCDGIVPDTCVKKYKEMAPTLGFDEGTCPLLDRDFTDECHISTSTGSARLSRESSCFVSSFPGLDIPEGYGVVSLVGIGYGESEDQGTLKPYDKIVQQSIAAIFTFFEYSPHSGASNQRRSHVLANQPVCAVPNHVLPGSRPVPSAGGKSHASFLALAMSVVLCALLF